MKIQLSDHFTYYRLLRFILPSVVMMVFTSIYSVVDGLFVSNFVGKAPFAALNLVYPVIMGLGALGFMIGTGGCAIVSKTMGEGDMEGANQSFSMLVYVTIFSGLVLTALGEVFLRPVVLFLGAQGTMVDDCLLYGRIVLAAQTAFMLQNVFQSFCVAAERPKLGLAIMVAAGVANMTLDFLFIAVFDWGLAGAALATALSQVTGGIIPLLYFAWPNQSPLRLVPARLRLLVLWKTCTNGSSELMTNLSNSVVNILYNFQLLRLTGEDGVAAFGVIMYVNFIFNAIFFGYSIGSGPIIAFHYGARNHSELKNLFRESMVFTAVSGIAMTALGVALARPLAAIFVGYEARLMDTTCRGLGLYALSFLFAGFNVFGSAFFTALNNGAVSAVISFLRTLVFQTAAVLLLPLLLGLDGIWLAMAAAELLALAVTALFLLWGRNIYQYG
ncbi:MAG: MATE family efflux transporter [Lawsonibacter sp.]|nr:MATE family efflux transporter [Lawsonibacter sp.]